MLSVVGRVNGDSVKVFLFCLIPVNLHWKLIPFQLVQLNCKIDILWGNTTIAYYCLIPSRFGNVYEK